MLPETAKDSEDGGIMTVQLGWVQPILSTFMASITLMFKHLRALTLVRQRSAIIDGQQRLRHTQEVAKLGLELRSPKSEASALTTGSSFLSMFSLW